MGTIDCSRSSKWFTLEEIINHKSIEFIWIHQPKCSTYACNKSPYDHKIHLFISKSDLNYSSCQFFIFTLPFQQLLPSFGFLEHSQAWSLPSDCEELIDHSPNPYTKHNTELASVDTAAAVPACRVRQREAERTASNNFKSCPSANAKNVLWILLRCGNYCCLWLFLWQLKMPSNQTLEQHGTAGWQPEWHWAVNAGKRRSWGRGRRKGMARHATYNS